MNIVLALVATFFPHHAPPVPTTTTTTTTAVVAAPPTTTTTTVPHYVVVSPPATTTTTTTAPPPAPAVASAAPSWQVSWIVRCPPARGVWYTYAGSYAQAQEIYDQQSALVGQPSSAGCFFGSVSEIQPVNG